MELTLYLSEKFISKFEIFRAIAEEVNFIFNCIAVCVKCEENEGDLVREMDK